MNKKILHISTVDYGGAGNAAYNMHKSFLKEGYDSKMLVFNKKRKDDKITEFQFPQFDLLKKGKRKIIYDLRKIIQKNIHPKYNFYNYSEISNYISTNLLVNQFPFQPNIIIFHWVTHFINARNINEIYKATKIPMFWNCLDMAPLTGGCHYAWQCDGFKNNCGYCPGLGAQKEIDISRLNYEYKSRYLSETPILILTPTHSLTQQVHESNLFNDNRKEKIMLAVDNNIFKPIEKPLARLKFNLPSHSKIIFAGAQNVSEERKGYHYFCESLKVLKNILPSEISEKVIVLLAGHINKEINIPFKTQHVGFLTESLLVKAYQSADLFLCTSIEDSGPVMINESIMSGTPVVSFNMGVAPDLVITGKTGYLAKLKDSQDMARGIQSILQLDKTSDKSMRQNCRELGLRFCHPSIQTKKITELFNKHSIYQS